MNCPRYVRHLHFLKVHLLSLLGIIRRHRVVIGFVLDSEGRKQLSRLAHFIFYADSHSCHLFGLYHRFQPLMMRLLLSLRLILLVQGG